MCGSPLTAGRICTRPIQEQFEVVWLLPSVTKELQLWKFYSNSKNFPFSFVIFETKCK